LSSEDFKKRGIEMLIGLVILVILAILVIAFIAMFNQFARLRNQVKNAWAGIEVQLRRRHDLIPNLVETAKGYLQHEKTVLENVVRARQQAIDVSGIKDKMQAENMLTQSLRSLFAVVENYPNLKADRTMLALQEELTSTENKVSFARNNYNDWVTRLNMAIDRFPTNLVAAMFGYGKAELFEIEDASMREAPQVKF
jgi:LemA protein